MAEVSQPAQVAERAKTQQELDAIYGGADGQLDEIETMMMKYDADRTGTFSIAEVKSIIHDLESHKKTAKHMGRALVGTIVVSLIVMGMLFAMMILSAESVKENHTTGGTMVDLEGEVVSVGQATSIGGIFDLPAMETEVLSTLQTITFYVVKTNSLEEWTVKVSGASRVVDGGNSVSVHTPQGWSIVIDGDARSGTLNMNGQSYLIQETADGRRLSSEDADWLACRPSDEICLPKRPSAEWMKARKRRLKERELRRGLRGLFTAGSFSTVSESQRAGNM